jgi:hypothetical protein
VKSCVTAFHVTCGFDNGLHMQTVWDDSAPDGVRHVVSLSARQGGGGGPDILTNFWRTF